MDGAQFDNMIRTLTESRRALIGNALLDAAGWLGVAGADAKRKRHKRRKHKNKPQFN
jgi:hypothetical protein